MPLINGFVAVENFLEDTNDLPLLGGLLGKLGGSKLSQNRFIAPFQQMGYDVSNPDFLRWLFGKRGNNTQRAGSLVLDMMSGNKTILAECEQWLIDDTKNGNYNKGGGNTSTIVKPTKTGGVSSTSNLITYSVIGFILLKMFKVIK